ncbi:MAG: aspartate racemase, partial [Acidobacteria bacterium]|nr:aspartate racemase [Acidobacteriota bacterium]
GAVPAPESDLDLAGPDVLLVQRTVDPLHRGSDADSSLPTLDSTRLLARAALRKAVQ